VLQKATGQTRGEVEGDFKEETEKQQTIKKEKRKAKAKNYKRSTQL